MKVKLLFVICLSVFSLCGIYHVQANKEDKNVSTLVLQNIESLAQNEGNSDHGNIDTTLEPYYYLSSRDYWLPGMNGTTKIPCCEKCSSQYSGCAKGLARC